MHPTLSYLLAQARTADLRQQAQRAAAPPRVRSGHRGKSGRQLTRSCRFGICPLLIDHAENVQIRRIKCGSPALRRSGAVSRRRSLRSASSSRC